MLTNWYDDSASMALTAVLAVTFTAAIVVSLIQGINVLDSLQAVSVIAASLVVVYGITEWRRAYIGKRKIELAEEVLALFYRVEVSIDYMRSPMFFSGEGSTREPQPGEPESQKATLDQCHVPIERFKKSEEHFSRLYALRFRFMATFGKEAAAPFLELDQLIKGLIADCHMLSNLRSEKYTAEGTAEEARRRTKETGDLRKRIWKSFTRPEDDPLLPEIKKIIEGIEAICQPHLS